MSECHTQADLVRTETTGTSSYTELLWDSGSQQGVILPPREHLVLSGDTLNCHGWGQGSHDIQTDIGWADSEDAAKNSYNVLDSHPQ